MKRILTFCLFLITMEMSAKSDVAFTKFWIYGYSVSQGLTVGSAKKEFPAAKRKGKTDMEQVAGLNEVLGRAKVKRIIPGKLGSDTRYLYCGAQAGSKRHDILVCDDFLVIDYTNKVEYLVSNDADKAWLRALGKYLPEHR